jgi:hypothetical protein
VCLPVLFSTGSCKKHQYPSVHSQSSIRCLAGTIICIWFWTFNGLLRHQYKHDTLPTFLFSRLNMSYLQKVPILNVCGRIADWILLNVI